MSVSLVPIEILDSEHIKEVLGRDNQSQAKPVQHHYPMALGIKEVKDIV